MVRPTAYQVSCPCRGDQPPSLPTFSSYSGVLVLIAALCREQTQAVGEAQPGSSLEYLILVLVLRI